jgi:hypothetical protein
MKSIIKKLKQKRDAKKQLDEKIKEKQESCDQHEFLSVPFKILYKEHFNIWYILFGGPKAIQIDTIVHICTKCGKEIREDIEL